MMNCEQCQDLMVDVLYGEEVCPRLSYQFFAHLRMCEVCDREYVALLETREKLSSWELTDEPVQPAQTFDDWGWRLSRTWWPALQKVAAAVLLAAGVLFILQQTGLVQMSSGRVSEGQLKAMVHDLVVAQQEETLRTIGEALLDIKEEMVLRNRASMDTVYDDMYTLEKRYLQVLEENNRQMGRLLKR